MLYKKIKIFHACLSNVFKIAMGVHNLSLKKLKSYSLIFHLIAVSINTVFLNISIHNFPSIIQQSVNIVRVVIFQVSYYYTCTSTTV